MAGTCRRRRGGSLSNRERPRGEQSRQTTADVHAHCSTSIESEGAGKEKGTFPCEHIGPWHGPRWSPGAKGACGVGEVIGRAICLPRAMGPNGTECKCKFG